MPNVIIVSGKAPGPPYYFKGYANGTLMLTEREENAVVVSEEDTPGLLTALARKSYHTFVAKHTARPVSWEKYRLRSDAAPARPAISRSAESKRRKKMSPQKAGAVVRKYRKFLGS